MRPGSSVTLWRWAGIPSCASIWAARCVRWEQRSLTGSVRWSLTREARGAAWWIALCRARCVVRWDEGYADPWLVLTDLAPEAANVVWYSMRTWIEGSFKDTKRGGWQWHQTKMTDPKRASRLWLAIAVATLWVVSVGGEADATQPCSGLEALPERHIARRTATKRSRPRLQSCFAQGLRRIFVAVLHGRRLPMGRFFPEPWPTTMPPRKKSKKGKKPPSAIPLSDGIPSPSQGSV